MKTAFKNRDGDWVVYDSITLDRYSLQGLVESVVEYLNEVRNDALAMGMVGEGSVELTTERGYYDDDYSVAATYEFTRRENDKERAARLDREAKLKDDAKAKRKANAEKKRLMADPEYAEFERLKAKFGGK
jgi:hypothetical protein